MRYNFMSIHEKDHNLKTKNNNKKCLLLLRRKKNENFNIFQAEIKNVTAALEAVWQFFKKLNTNQCMVCS